MKGAYRCLTFLVFLCLIKALSHKPCSTVRATRASRSVPEGSRLQLDCEVLHCGEAGWTGGWVFQEINSTEFIPLTPSERIKLSSYNSTDTRLTVDILKINQSDAGAYKCMINWPGNVSSSGHVTYVNVTAAAGEISQSRSRSHNVLLFPGVFMCILVILGMFLYMSRDKPPPPPVPRPRTSFAARVKPNKEVVYAEVAVNDSRIQFDQPKQASEPTVYSALQFS